MISHKYRFIFVRCRKTASTSLEMALSRFLGPDDGCHCADIPRDEQIRTEPAHLIIFELLAAAGTQPSGTPFVIYYGKVNVNSDGLAAACVPFTGSLEPQGEVKIRIDPAREEAFSCHDPRFRRRTRMDRSTLMLPLRLCEESGSRHCGSIQEEQDHEASP